MLQVKSFKISDSEGMNELLKTNRIAQGANILVSDGSVCIPYEDGLPETNEQKRINLIESKNKLSMELDIINHSQKVLKNKINGAIEQLNTQKADLEELKKTEKTKGTYDNKKNKEDEAKRLENVIAQFEMSMVNSQAEITNKVEDIKVYDEEIKELE